MGRDRTSTITLENKFSISCDKDHLGQYRGNQALISNDKQYYRGWHYHIEHPRLSQDRIFDLLEIYLNFIHAQKIFIRNICSLGIGIVENEPSRISYYVLNGLSTVLWISSSNHKLHIETNKDNVYKKGIFTKKLLIELFNSIRWDLSSLCPHCKINLFSMTIPHDSLFFCAKCDYSMPESEIEAYYLAKAENYGV